MDVTNIREQIYKAKKRIKHTYYDYVKDKYIKNLRTRLKNDNFTILASNCIGGYIYHRLGKKFLSPTINLWFYNNEFIRFLNNLDYYLELDLVFIESSFPYPVAKLDDISLFFLHYSNETEARKAWNRRKKRIMVNAVKVFTLRLCISAYYIHFKRVKVKIFTAFTITMIIFMLFCMIGMDWEKKIIKLLIN